MNTTLRKELPIIIIALLPTVYLFFIWNALPAIVPTHWNINGKTNGYSSKTVLLWVALQPCLIYLIFSVVTKIDPKGKLNSMGNKLQNLKLLLTTFVSFLVLWILYSVKKQSLGNPNVLIIATGILFIILGNYFKTIKPNYFIGIKTPWTLEDETNWKETHKLAGKLWFVGGLLIVLSSFIFSAKTNLMVMFIVIAILVVVPIVYSYLFFKRVKKMA